MHPARFLGLVRAGAFVCLTGLVAGCVGGDALTFAPTTAGTTLPPATAVAPTDTTRGNVTGALSVLDWEGFDQDIFWQDFKDKYQTVDVTFEFGGSDADIYDQVQTGASTSDIFHPYTGWLQLYVDDGLAAEIDTTRLKNWDKVPESFRKLGQVNGKQYFVPWDWGYGSVLYRTDKIASVDSWSALTDPKYDGHIMMWDDGPGAVTVSSYIHGWDVAALTDAQLAKARAEWTGVLKANPTPWVDDAELVDGMQNGDVWAGYSWQGAYATLFDSEVPVAYASPKEGRNAWVGMYGIRADSPNYDLALRFLDEKLGDATGNNLVVNYYYGTANRDVMAAITDPFLKEAFSVDDPTILAQTNFAPNLTSAQRAAWIKMWSEAKAAAGVGG
jgi:spermidine/putrescine transport system substrate-binding protein